MRTDANLKIVCDALRETFGDFHNSCRRAGLSVDFVTNWLKDDKEAAELVEEARRVGFMGLEGVAIQRATQGVKKAVYYKGAVVGHDIQYSDGLLTRVMEARIPEYKKGEGSGNTFNGPTQINVMPRAENFDQWLEMKNTTLKARADEKAAQLALNAPRATAEDASFTELPLATLKGLL